MTKYKGYYIDGVWFNSKADIDAYVKQQAVESYKRLCEYFTKHPSLEASKMCDEQAQRLHRIFGFTYDEIEAFEIEAITAASTAV